MKLAKNRNINIQMINLDPSAPFAFCKSVTSRRHRFTKSEGSAGIEVVFVFVFVLMGLFLQVIYVKYLTLLYSILFGLVWSGLV